MKLTIVAVIVLICSLWFVRRIYSRADDAPKKDQTDEAVDNADEGGCQVDSDE